MMRKLTNPAPEGEALCEASVIQSHSLAAELVLFTVKYVGKKFEKQETSILLQGYKFPAKLIVMVLGFKQVL